MDLNQVIAELVKSHSGICVLDKIHLPYTHSDAGPAAKFGLGIELYLPDVDRTELR
jgi:hypothetical protein